MMTMRILVLLVLAASQPSQGADCPCSSAELCNPILQSKGPKEVFGFVRSWINTEAYWNTLYWDKLTTIATLGITDDRLTCMAHSHGVRVLVTPSHISQSDMMDEAKLDAWVDEEVQFAVDHFYDGFDIDYEATVPQDSALAIAITDMVRKLKEKMQAVDPNRAYMAFCLPYKLNWFSRHYQHAELNEFVDIYFIMAYDEDRFNSAYDQTKTGVESFLANDLIPKEKLLVGLAWYGRFVWCNEQYNRTEAMSSEWLPCRVVNYAQWDLTRISRAIRDADEFVLKWDDNAKSPFYYFPNKYNGKLLIALTENYESWLKKRRLVDEFDLVGFGVYPLSYVDLTDQESMDPFKGAFYIE